MKYNVVIIKEPEKQLDPECVSVELSKSVSIHKRVSRTYKIPFSEAARNSHSMCLDSE
jgi:hypothetical protein